MIAKFFNISKRLNTTLLLTIVLVIILIASKEYLPRTEINKLTTEIGSVLAAVGVLAGIWGSAISQGRAARQAELNALEKQLYSDINDLRNDLRNMSEELNKAILQFSIHAESFGHERHLNGYYELKEKVTRLEVELRLNQNINSLIDDFELIKRKINS